jgi:hypothetical protein
MIFVLAAAFTVTDRSALDRSFDLGSSSAVFAVLFVAWSYALIAPLSVMPVERGAFQMLRVEKLALRLPRLTISSLSADPASVPVSGRHWNQMQTLFENDYLRHRRVHNGFFFLARFLAAATLLALLALSVACFRQAVITSAAAFAFGGGAVLSLAFVPIIVTLVGARYRWHRRTPFELLWVHEARTVLARHRKAAEKGHLERTEILVDIEDMDYVLGRRHCFPESRSNRRAVRNSWAAHTFPLVAIAAEFEGRSSVPSPHVWMWLSSYVNQASRLVSQSHGEVAPLDNVRPWPSRYSSDRAGIGMTLLLLGLFAGLFLAAWLTSGATTFHALWDGVQKAFEGGNSIVATLAGLVPILAWLGIKRPHSGL